MNKTIKTAELALGMYFGDHVAPTLPNGRLKGKMLKLSKLINREFEYTYFLGPASSKQAKEMVLKFMDVSNWGGRSLSYITLANFLLALYDERPYPKEIVETINDIYEYYARVKKAPKACEWSAAEAQEKWENIVNETN